MGFLSAIPTPSQIAGVLNLSVDVKRDYGASGSPQTVLGTIAAGSNILTLSEPGDFKNGQGVSIVNAGIATTAVTPNAPSVSVGGGLHGTTYEWGYQTVELDANGGCSGPSLQSTVTTGAELSMNPPEISSGTWINLNTSGGSGASVAVYRTLVPSGSSIEVGFIGVYTYFNTPFLDYGQAPKTPPSGLPPTLPAEALSQTFVSTVVSGAGTNTLVLSDSAVTACTDAAVLHDDTVAVQLAVDSGQAVFFPAGTYRISDAIFITTDYQKVYGESWNSLLSVTSNANSGIVVNSASHVVIENLAVYGNRYAANNVYVINNGSTVPNDVFINHVATYGAGFTAVNFYNDSNEWCYRATVQNCYIEDFEYGYSFLGNFDYVVIANNFSEFTDYNYSGRGISLHNDGGGSQKHFTITGNVIHGGNHTGALVLQGCGLGSVTGNTFLSAGGVFGIAYFGDDELLDGSGAVSIVGNYIESSWDGAGVAIMFDNVQTVTVADNVLRRFGYGFEIGYPGSPAWPDQLSNHIVISGNQMYDLTIGPLLSIAPLSVKFINNGGLNPIGSITPPASPLVSGTIYQNTHNVDVTVHQEVYAATSGTSGAAIIHVGTSSTAPAQLYTQYISGDTDSTVPIVITFRVPQGNYYSVGGSGIVFGSTSIYGD